MELVKLSFNVRRGNQAFGVINSAIGLGLDPLGGRPPSGRAFGRTKTHIDNKYRAC
jgi:hypothetical protein